MMGLACLGLMAGSAVPVLGRKAGSPDSPWGDCHLYNLRIAAQPKGKAGDLGSFLHLEIVPLPSWFIQQ